MCNRENVYFSEKQKIRNSCLIALKCEIKKTPQKYAHSVGINFILISWNDIGIGTLWSQVKQCIADFAVR